MMTPRISAAAKLAVLLASFAVIVVGFGMTSASAEPKRKFDNRGRPYYGQNGPNVVYQQGPHRRIYVTKRSWLDAGFEVLPGDRKFPDCAFPSEYGDRAVGRESRNR